MLDMGSPSMAVCGKVILGGPTTVGWAVSFACSLRITIAGGVTCSRANRGAVPFEADK
jgi:hypothetical protein